MMTTKIRSSGKFGRSHHDDETTSSLGSHEIDIDFSVTESGRTVAHLVSHLEKADDNNDDDNDFGVGITQSGRSFTRYVNTNNNNNKDDSEVEGIIGRTVGGGGGNSGGDENIYTSSSAATATAMSSSSSNLPHATSANTNKNATTSSKRRSAARPIPNPSQDEAGSQGSSGSGFLSGIMNQNNNSKGILSHTPPSAMAPTSYEAHHFGKRVRAGSISGRLRSASDVEANGLIDRQQKAILKDLIISGDQDVQAALDKFEMGDTNALEKMIKDGVFHQNATSDMDLLGDLDLDFLSVADDYAGMEAAAAIDQHRNQNSQQQQQQHMPAKQQTVLPHPGKPKSQPIPMHPPPNLPTKQQVQQMTIPHNTQSNMVSPSLQSTAYDGADDGIGDLDFNGDFSTGDEVLQMPSQQGGWGGKHHIQNSPTTLEEQQRFRSNSLAFGALLGEPPHLAEGHNSSSYNRWVDRHHQAGGENNMGVPLTNRSIDHGKMVRENGGIGASLEQYGRSKSESKLKTKAMLAEEKRRKKQEKKEQKEREKREKKERREQVKRERGVQEKQERKYKKSAASKAREEREKEEEDEERMETPSGLGRPRSMSDPNLSVSTVNGLLEVERPDGWVGAYSPESRKIRIDRFLAKRNKRIWTKTVKYDVRKNFADSRLRVKGRFVKKEDEMLMRDLISLT